MLPTTLSAVLCSLKNGRRNVRKQKNASTQNRVGASASDTAVPNGSGAKVLQNLEKAKNFYKNNANRARGFITDVARVNKNSRKLEINDIRSLHYRNDMNIVNWINEDLADYIKPSFAEEWFEPMKNELRSKPQYNSADVRTQLVSAANKIKSFENPKQNGENNAKLHYAVLSKLKDVIKNSIDTEIHPDYKKVNGVRSKENGFNDNMLIHRMYGAFEYNGTVYRVKKPCMSIEELKTAVRIVMK